MWKRLSLLRSFMVKRSSGINTTTSTTNMKPDYSSWSKEDLVARITELEKSLLVTSDALPKVKKPKKAFDWSKQNMRFVAFRFAYLGWNYNGLAFQLEPTPLPTVEEMFLKVLAKVKLIKEPIEDVEFSRCGRTDKGVSAMNQVISIKVRSNLTKEDQANPELDDKEIDYLSILNANLPSDIKAHAVCLRPPQDFDARFSCISRHYRYFFKKQDLDTDLMNQAANLYQGIHDFRNFCKLDGSKQITNFMREIYSSKIIHLHDDVYCFDLKGSAFLWHQVRCMVAILFTVGQGLERPEIVTELMDTDKYPTKPVYEMANDIPLVLYDCEFPEMEWKTVSDEHKFQRTTQSFNKMEYDIQLKAQMLEVMEEVLYGNRSKSDKLLRTMNIGDGIGRAFKQYVPLAKRDRMESYEILNARWLEKKGDRWQQKREEKELKRKEQVE
ncbi:tRNA pseudouridine(38/39) synthase [Candida viswanathii]|uniref:tRNA pseudouridine(38/39) synthase n=1 Tax=Candida viswanathii TaxID=5486 RepID=A0A367YJ66_9ASCO|nr:tRNA pseudouridine(38/39) synthase [Candida viswanathii]